MQAEAPNVAIKYTAVILSCYVIGLVILWLHFVKQKYGQVRFLSASWLGQFAGTSTYCFFPTIYEALSHFIALLSLEIEFYVFYFGAILEYTAISFDLDSQHNWLEERYQWTDCNKYLFHVKVVQSDSRCLTPVVWL